MPIMQFLQKLPQTQTLSIVSQDSGPYVLRRLEDYEPTALVKAIRERKPLRISVPEAVARLQANLHLDWSKEVELPPPIDIGNEPLYGDHEDIEWRMESLRDRYSALVTLTHRLDGRLLYTMLSGDRYAVWLEWNPPLQESSLRAEPSV